MLCTILDLGRGSFVVIFANFSTERWLSLLRFSHSSFQQYVLPCFLSSDPGGVLVTCLSATRIVAFRRMQSVGFGLLPDCSRGYPFVHHYTHFGAQ
jgi:hypothetical protein